MIVAKTALYSTYVVGGDAVVSASASELAASLADAPTAHAVLGAGAGASAGAATSAREKTPAATPQAASRAPATTPAGYVKESIEQYLLTEAHGTVADTQELVQSMGWNHDDVVSVCKSLEADAYLVSAASKQKFSVLTADGKDAAEHGSPEVRLLREVRAGSIATKEAAAAEHKIGWMKCMANKWLKEEAGKLVVLTDKAPAADAVDEVQAQLRSLAGLADKDRKELMKRKLVEEKERTSFALMPGPKFAATRVKPSVNLTKAMLDDGSWETTTFKPVNWNAMGQAPGGGSLHPLLKVRFEFRKILIGMGFEEMPTNRWVESSFWNFDALFQPQQHPARDSHDTFFIAGPAAQSNMDAVNADYLAKVRAVHERGGFGSVGYRSFWDVNEARKNVLRTHTTAVSARMLYALANRPGGFSPVKYFSVDRVFRNESVDKTHLAEFHQVEGLVADYALTLGDLKGTIRAFFKAIGITKVRFKPAYNPYTEPSMEIFGFHPQLNKWTEIGNSGMFRPEMLLPMGLPEGVRVIAWGLSLERPTMIMTGEDHIKNLFGSGVSFDMMRAFPLARFKKDKP